MAEKTFISIPELAKILGISRIAVYNQVKAGKIKAIRIGRNYAISADYVAQITGKELTEANKNQINRAVKKTVREYGEVLKKLGEE